MITSRSLETLDAFQKEIESMGRKALPVQLDVRDYDSIQQMVEDAWGHYGQIEILVNNAGCHVRKPSVDVTWNDWNLVLDTNLRGTFFVAQAVARKMIPRRYGKIINIGSTDKNSLFFGVSVASVGRCRLVCQEKRRHNIWLF